MLLRRAVPIICFVLVHDPLSSLQLWGRQKPLLHFSSVLKELRLLSQVVFFSFFSLLLLFSNFSVKKVKPGTNIWQTIWGVYKPLSLHDQNRVEPRLIVVNSDKTRLWCSAFFNLSSFTLESLKQFARLTSLSVIEMLSYSSRIGFLILTYTATSIRITWQDECFVRDPGMLWKIINFDFSIY